MKARLEQGPGPGSGREVGGWTNRKREGGPGGLCAAKELLEAGFDDLVLLEKCDGVGGTWFINRYPGCACDVQTHLYSFSFEIKPDWSRPFAPQPELLAYFEGIAEKHGILPYCRFGTEVVRATWDEDRSVWRLEVRWDPPRQLLPFHSDVPGRSRMRQERPRPTPPSRLRKANCERPFRLGWSRFRAFPSRS